MAGKKMNQIGVTVFIFLPAIFLPTFRFPSGRNLRTPRRFAWVVTPMSRIQRGPESTTSCIIRDIRATTYFSSSVAWPLLGANLRISGR